MKDPWYEGIKPLMFNGMGRFSPRANPPYYPKLGDAYSRRMIPAGEWWREIVFILDGNTSMARKDVVLAAADKHGGAHVDAKLTPSYERLIASHNLGSIEVEGGELLPIGGHHYVALRQMGYEVLNSPDLTGLAAAA